MRVLVETAVRVKGRDPSGRSGRYTKMQGLPYSDEPHGRGKSFTYCESLLCC